MSYEEKDILLYSFKYTSLVWFVQQLPVPGGKWLLQMPHFQIKLLTTCSLLYTAVWFYVYPDSKRDKEKSTELKCKETAGVGVVAGVL